MTWPQPLPAAAPLGWTLGRAVVTEAGPHDSLVLISWQLDSVVAPRVRVQIYVNDQLVAVSGFAQQTDHWLILDRQHPQRIELLLVDAADPETWWVPQVSCLRGWSPAIDDHIEIAVLRDEAWPIDAQLEVELNGQPAAAGPLWSRTTPRSGFGGLFGLGGFGLDDAAGPGLGRGELGLGPLGIDATAWPYRSPPLPPGDHTLTLRTHDAAGRPLTPPQTLAPVTTVALPTPPQNLTVHPDFTLTWTD